MARTSLPSRTAWILPLGILFCLGLALTPSTWAQESTQQSQGILLPEAIRTLSVKFARTYAPAGGVSEQSSGWIYCEAPSRVLVKVEKPIEQIMEVEGEHVRIYYPLTGEAFDILTSFSESLPFLHLFLLGGLDEDAGLERSGFALKRYETRGDTTFAYWDPPISARKAFGSAVLTRLGQALLCVEMLDPKGRTLLRNECSGTLEHSGYQFPSQVSVRVFKGRGRGVDSASYSELTINDPLPEWVRSFQLPVGAVVKDLR